MKSLGKSFSWSFFDKITTQGISFFVSIVLARLISPDHYGLVALAAIIVEIFDVFVNPGICSALVQKKDAGKEDYDSLFIVNICISVVLFFIIIISADWIQKYYELNNLAAVIKVLALKLPFAALHSIQMAYVQKNFLFKKYFWVSLIGTVFAGTVGIIMAFQGFGVWALVAYTLGDAIIDSLVALIFIPWRPSLSFSRQRFMGLFSFGQKIFFVKLLDICYEKISGLIIGKKYTTADLACYDKGKRFPQLIINNIINPLSEILFPSLSNIQDEKTKLTNMMRETTNLTIYVIFPILFGFFSCADTFVRVILTDKWIECVPYLRITCVTLLTLPVCTVIYQAIKAIGYGNTLLKMEGLKKSIGVVLLVMSVFCGQGPLYIAVVMTVTAYISLIIDLVLASKHLNFSTIQHYKDIFKILLSCLIMLIGVMAIGRINAPQIIVLIVQIVVGILIYLICSVIFKISQFYGLFELIKGKEHE